MVDREVFDRRLARLELLLTDLRPLGTVPIETLERDRALQAQAERWLHLAAECVLDLANHLIADRGWETPATYREAFTILERHGVVSSDEAKRLQAWAGLRNVLVHLYLEIDYGVLHQVLEHDLDDLERFAAAAARAADGEGSP